MLDRLVNTRATTTLRALLKEDLNFLLTNRVPRIVLTRFMGWFSRIRQPLVRDVSIAVWRWFDPIDLSDAKKRQFDSVHDMFTRELVDGARPVDADPAVLVSPCDAIVGACGGIDGAEIIQAKELAYSLTDLLQDEALAASYRGGCYATLRLKSSMYHRFHAPADCTVREVTYIAGDTWNVNPIALARVERLFCRNERAVIRARLHGSAHMITLVPVAAILVAGIRLHFLDLLLHLGYRGRNHIRCAASFTKGREMGWFEHGSTIIVLAPRGFVMCDGVDAGTTIRAGQKLMRVGG
ncbi:MAG TPA: archaetidylserine decarboxylase [Burkholderiaceae bacterium]|nr:archaetidylserine decarboxylase [Burkholderiaceae bacterium]